MISILATIYPSIIQILALSVLLFLCIRLLIENKESMPAIFLTFTFALCLFSDIYWLVYDFLRPNVRMPFAANEFGEAGLFLMFAATINTAIPHGSRCARKQTIGVILFMISNIVLWILWSGEWLQDILIGAIFTWLVYSAVCSLKVVRALKKQEWVLLAIYCFVLIAGQTSTFLVAEQYKQVVDIGCYVLLCIAQIYWLVKLALAYKKKASPETLLSLAASNAIWSSISLYMSEGTIYTVFMIIGTISFIFMYMAVRKVVNKS